MVIANEVTRSVEMKKQMVAERQHFYDLFMQAPAIIAVLQGPNHTYNLANPLYMQLIGQRPIVGKPVREALPELAGQGIYELLDEVYSSGKPFIGKEVFVKLDRKGNGKAEDGYFNFVYQPSYDEKGKVNGILVHGVDITEQILARNKVEESERKYRTLFNSIEDGFCIIEKVADAPLDFRYIEANPALEAQSGIKNVVGKTIRQVLQGEADEWVETFNTILETGKPIRFERGLVAQGRVLELYAFQIPDVPQLRIAVLFKDITERKQAEAKLKESEQRFRAIVDGAPVFIFLAGVNAEVELLNKTWLDYTGLTSEESKGRAWVEITHPDDVDPATKIYMDGFNKRESCTFENRQKGVDGIYRTILWKATPRFSPSGEFIGMMGVGIDIHERKRLEQQKDEFIGIASHELKTPVTSIKAYTQVLQSRLLKEGNTKLAEHLGKMDGQLDKLTNLIADLLDSTKIEAGKLQFHEEYFDFNELVGEIIDEIQRTTHRHRILTELVKSKTVYGDRDRIGQVIINLLTNAIKYSPQADKIIVKTIVDKKNITLSVQDFGIGISKEKQGKVFERFYRVEEREHHETYAGLGLGLFISSEIIKRQNGKIWIESEVGKGSTVCFSLLIEIKRHAKQQINNGVPKEIKHDR